MQILDPQHPFFKPVWRRVLTVVVPAAWALVELSNGATGWAVLFFAAAGYAAYQLFVVYKPDAQNAANIERQEEADGD